MQNTLSATRTLFSSFLRIRTLTTSSTSPELHQSRTELLTTLSSLATDIAELQAAIAAVQQDPYRFGLDGVEVGRRREFVREVKGEVEGMRKEVMETGNSENGGGAVGLPDPSSFREEGEGDEDGYGYGEFEQQQQQEMMQDQDVQLDGVYRTVGNLRVQAEDMGRELEEQEGILGEVDVLADRVGGKLQNGVKRVGHIIRKNEGVSEVIVFVFCMANSRAQTRCRVAASLSSSSS